MTTKNLDDPSKDGIKSSEENNELDTFEDRPKTPREEAMERMVANSSNERDKSRQEFIEDNGFDPMAVEEEEIVEEEIEEIIEEEPEETLDTPELLADTPIIERDGQQFMQLNVNGQMKEMPVEVVQAAMQKAENADQRIWEANQSKQKYDDLIAQHDQSATLPDASSEIAVDTQETLKEALTKVYDGEVDEAAEVLGKVLLPAQTAAPVDLNAQIDARVAAREDHRDLQSAYNEFMADDEFKQVTSDPVLLERVNTFTEDLQRDPEFMKTKPSYEDFFREAGKRTKDWVETISGTKLAPTEEKEVDSRLERKRLTPSQPASRTVRRGPKPEAKPHTKTTNDIIREMAEKRGQTNL